jgi:hypothetical protein
MGMAMKAGPVNGSSPGTLLRGLNAAGMAGLEWVQF